MDKTCISLPLKNFNFKTFKILKQRSIKFLSVNATVSRKAPLKSLGVTRAFTLKLFIKKKKQKKHFLGMILVTISICLKLLKKEEKIFKSL